MLIPVIKFIMAFVFGNYLLFGFQPAQARMSISKILSAYLFRVLLGCLYGYLMLTYYPNDDTVLFHQMGIDEYHELINNPKLFFGDFLNTDAFRDGNGVLEIIYYYLRSWEKWLFIKLLALFNLFSHGNYYINMVFLNVISFKGCHYLYSALKRWYSQSDIYLYILVFYFPPVIFWLSGIRGEALLIFFIGLLVLAVIQHKKGYLRNVFIVASLLGILIMRSQLFLLLCPGLLAYFICTKTGTRPLKVFLATYSSIIAIVLVTALLPDKYNLLLITANKQASFKSLSSHSIFYLPDIDGSVLSYLRAIPYAVLNTFFRPLFIDSNGLLQLLASVETLFVLLVSFYWIITVSRKGSEIWSSPILLLLFFFAVTNYVLIGLVVNFPGVVIRYRSIPELLLLICLIMDLRKVLPVRYR